MTLYDIENRTIDELLQGHYHDEKKGHVCLHCEFTCSNLKEMVQHWEDVHSQDAEANFLSLLNMDSILDMSYVEKGLYHAFYLQMGDKEIEETLKMKGSTIRSYRRLLQKELLRCKAMLMICEKLNLTKRPYNKKVEPDQRLPGLDDAGNVIGFFSKDRVHSSTDAIHHYSTLLLVSQRDQEGQFRFLTCTKSSKLITQTGIIGPFRKKWIDCEGGLCQESDSDNIALGKPLNDEIFLHAAKREFLEEVHIKGFQLDPDKLVYLYTDECDKPLHPTGHNRETSAVYIYLLPDHIPKANILVRDEWTDSIGEVVKKKYPSELMTWDEIEAISESDESDMALMDGLGRVVERMKQDPALKKRMFDLLENADI